MPMNLRHLFCKKPRNKCYDNAFAIVVLQSGEIGFMCMECKRTSFHPKDLEHLYCACCHKFLDPAGREHLRKFFMKYLY